MEYGRLDVVRHGLESALMRVRAVGCNGGVCRGDVRERAWGALADCSRQESVMGGSGGSPRLQLPGGASG